MILKKKIINKSNFFLMQISLLKQIKTKHHWHLVDPSPWPLMASVAAFSLTTGGVLYMHNYILGSSLFKIGLFMLLFVMYTWWRDVVREATFEEHHNVAVQRGLRLGMILFIVSEIMFFFAFFWAFFHSSLSPVFNIGGVWPPEAIITISSSGIPLTNTIFLLSSGATVTWSHHAIRARSKKHTILGFGSCFYMTTGFHGFHVFIGTCCLFVSLFRVVINHFTSIHHFGLESAIWYWHFVDVVWLFLFIMVYWWGC